MDQQPEEEGASQQGGDDPHREVDRRKEGAGEGVREGQEAAAQEDRCRDQVAVIRPAEQPEQMGND